MFGGWIDLPVTHPKENGKYHPLTPSLSIRVRSATTPSFWGVCRCVLVVAWSVRVCDPFLSHDPHSNDGVGRWWISVWEQPSAYSFVALLRRFERLMIDCSVAENLQPIVVHNFAADRTYMRVGVASLSKWPSIALKLDLNKKGTTITFTGRLHLRTLNVFAGVSRTEANRVTRRRGGNSIWISVCWKRFCFRKRCLNMYSCNNVGFHSQRAFVLFWYARNVISGYAFYLCCL